MRRLITIFFLFLLITNLLLCKKENAKVKNTFFLLGFLLSQNSSGCNPQSGFTICIPKGIAE